MKVITLGKCEDCEMHTKNDIIKEKEMDITSNEAFNYLKICNSKKGKSIYILENIELWAYDNKVRMLTGEERCSNEEESFSLTCGFLENSEDYLEIRSFYIMGSAANTLISEQIIFILPGGCLILKFENPINKVKIKINWIEESID